MPIYLMKPKWILNGEPYSSTGDASQDMTLLSYDGDSYGAQNVVGDDSKFTVSGGVDGVIHKPTSIMWANQKLMCAKINELERKITRAFGATFYVSKLGSGKKDGSSINDCLPFTDTWFSGDNNILDSLAKLGYVFVRLVGEVGGSQQVYEMDTYSLVSGNIVIIGVDSTDTINKDARPKILCSGDYGIVAIDSTLILKNVEVEDGESISIVVLERSSLYLSGCYFKSKLMDSNNDGAIDNSLFEIANSTLYFVSNSNLYPNTLEITDYTAGATGAPTEKIYSAGGFIALKNSFMTLTTEEGAYGNDALVLVRDVVPISKELYDIYILSGSTLKAFNASLNMTGARSCGCFMIAESSTLIISGDSALKVNTPFFIYSESSELFLDLTHSASIINFTNSTTIPQIGTDANAGVVLLAVNGAITPRDGAWVGDIGGKANFFLGWGAEIGFDGIFKVTCSDFVDAYACSAYFYTNFSASNYNNKGFFGGKASKGIEGGLGTQSNPIPTADIQLREKSIFIRDDGTVYEADFN